MSGIASGLLAVVAAALGYVAQDTFRRVPPPWMWWHAIGGVIIGMGGMIVSQAHVLRAFLQR